MTDISELNTLRARIVDLEALAARDNQERPERVTTRRGLLRLAGAAAVGGLAAAVVAEPVAAGVDGDLVMNLSNNLGTGQTGIAMQSGTPAYGFGCYEFGLASLPADIGRPALFGHANSSAFTTGVAGFCTLTGGTAVVGSDESPNSVGTGVKGLSTLGTGVKAYGGSGGLLAAGGNYGVFARSDGSNGNGIRATGRAGALYLSPYSDGAPQTRGSSFGNNTLETDGEGNVWFCYEAGTPGKWRKLAGPATGGAFHPITPTRVYDSRAAAPSAGLLAAGLNRTIFIADGRDASGIVTTPNLVPAGATAVAANITVTGTTGDGGYLAVNPGGLTAVSASTINWFGVGQNIANGVTLTLNATRELTVVCGAGGGSTHFIIDIAGYYL